jgi:uncharacterized Zn finger protein
MLILTSKLLDDYPYFDYADPKTIQRGQIYFRQGRVWDVNLHSGIKAICMVNGDSSEYTVEIEVDQKC